MLIVNMLSINGGAFTLAAVVSHDAQAFGAFVASVLQTGSVLLAHGDAANRPFRQSSARWRVRLYAAQSKNSVPLIARSTGYPRQATQRLADALGQTGSPVTAGTGRSARELADERPLSKRYQRASCRWPVH